MRVRPQAARRRGSAGTARRWPSWRDARDRRCGVSGRVRRMRRERLRCRLRGGDVSGDGLELWGGGSRDRAIVTLMQGSGGTYRRGRRGCSGCCWRGETFWRIALNSGGRRWDWWSWSAEGAGRFRWLRECQQEQWTCSSGDDGRVAWRWRLDEWVSEV